MIAALVVAWAVALFAGFTMTMRLRRVLAVTQIDVAVLARATKRDRSAIGKWPPLLAETPVAELATALAIADETTRAAAVNEALSDLGGELAWGAELSGAALRVLLFGTILASLVPSLVGASGDDFLERTMALVAVGGGAAIGVLAARRVIDAHVVEARLAIDAWVDASTKSTPST